MRTNRCIIRVLKQNDYEDIKKLYVNHQVREFLGGVVTEERYNECFVKMTATKDDELYWGIRLNDTNELIGLVSLDTHHNTISKELSYQFLPAYWGKGYALEVTREILYYAFNELGVERVVSETQTANKLSCKLLNKLGMKIVESVYRFGEEQYIFALDNPEISKG